MATRARRRATEFASDLQRPKKWAWWLRHYRLHQAWKGAAAAVAAWQLAVLLPAPPGQYPYYAPLGAVLAMYPTVAGSLRQALRSLFAVCLGAMLAVAAVALSLNDALLLAGVVGVGMLLAVWRPVGTQGTWVPTSALFVLLVGGDQPWEYVASYVGEILLGLAVGVFINFLVFPPLHVSLSLRRLNELRTTVAERLDAQADVIDGNGADDDRAGVGSRFEELTADVRTAVSWADEAGRANLRARWHRRQLDAQSSALQPLEHAAILIRDVDRLLSADPASGDRALLLDEDTRAPLSGALRCVANALRAVDDPAHAHSCLDDARHALDELVHHAETQPMSIEYMSGTALLAADMNRVLDSMQPRDGGAPPPVAAAGY